VLELLLDKKAVEARHARDVAARDAEISRLQLYISDELAELQQRQAQVCRVCVARMCAPGTRSNLHLACRLSCAHAPGGGSGAKCAGAAAGRARGAAGQPAGVARGLRAAEAGASRQAAAV
jgi:hypothetical protein